MVMTVAQKAAEDTLFGPFARLRFSDLPAPDRCVHFRWLWFARVFRVASFESVSAPRFFCLRLAPEAFRLVDGAVIYWLTQGRVRD